jgi:hypothetical protein
LEPEHFGGIEGVKVAEDFAVFAAASEDDDAGAG